MGSHDYAREHMCVCACLYVAQGQNEPITDTGDIVLTLAENKTLSLVCLVRQVLRAIATRSHCTVLPVPVSSCIVFIEL